MYFQVQDNSPGIVQVKCSQLNINISQVGIADAHLTQMAPADNGLGSNVPHIRIENIILGRINSPKARFPRCIFIEGFLASINKLHRLSVTKLTVLFKCFSFLVKELPIHAKYHSVKILRNAIFAIVKKFWKEHRDALQK